MILLFTLVLHQPNIAIFTFSAGADPNLRDEVGQTPLHKAVLSGEENMIEALLIHGADPDIMDSVGHGHTALAWFFDNPLNARCLYALELLLQVSPPLRPATAGGQCYKQSYETLLLPVTELGQGNIFSSVCQEFCPQGGVPGQEPPSRYTPQQVHPLGRYTPGQAHPPDRYTPHGQ